jgi:hypothetical protein
MTHKNNNREYWLQVVPEGITDAIEIIHYVAEHAGIVGNYRIHSDSATITEAQATELVEEVYRSDLDPHETDLMNGDWVEGYRNYCNEDYTNHYLLAVQSFESLLRSLNINNRVIILEKLC